MDTRFFDMFDPPQNVICVDLDTNTISWTPDRNSINLKILPKKPLAILKAKLTQIEVELRNVNEFRVQNAKNTSNKTEIDLKIKRKERLLDLMIREAFLRFMASILQNYKTFLRTVTRKPDIKAIDRNLSKFFDSEGNKLELL